MRTLEKAINEVSFFVSDELYDKFQEVMVKVREANEDNVEAQIPVGNIYENKMDIRDFDYCEDYEILTGVYRNAEGEEYDSLESFLEYQKGRLEAKIEIKEETDEDGNTCFNVYADGVFVNYAYDREEAEEVRNDVIESAMEDQEGIFENEYEFEADEIYVNTVRQIGGDVDIEIAKKLGLGVLEMNETEEKWLFLCGCGMDFSPLFIGYQALVYKFIKPEDVRSLIGVNTDFFKYVVGDDNFKEIVKSLGIERFFAKHLED